jgi:dTDP-4-amino-4,6-dideoxygalactose transaminase
MEHRPALAFEVVKNFEQAVGLYTGAPFVVAVNSCTMALRLCLEWHAAHKCGEELGYLPTVTIPKRTYVSVPMQVKAAGFDLAFQDEQWEGSFRMKPFRIWDSARWFTRGIFAAPLNGGKAPDFVCVSFHASKTLGIEQGGAILHNAGPEVDHWLRCMRHDGRIEGQPITNAAVKYLGLHCYMSPSVAAQGLLKLHSLPDDNEMQAGWRDYADLSTFEVFK